ncbi:MAG: hypothetical protein LUH63_05665 [Parabacteroides sp.]|nr:hypothetical protein [Parabacteroides sp.]
MFEIVDLFHEIPGWPVVTEKIEYRPCFWDRFICGLIKDLYFSGIAAEHIEKLVLA